MVTFVDLKKVYDSIGQTSLIQILKELGLSNKTRAFIQHTLTNTTSKMKFRGEISDTFKIRIGAWQGNELSSLFFNFVLEKVM